MDLQNEKSNGCVLYRSIVEAAEELEKDQALELLLTYAHLGFGDDVNLEECDKVVRLILKQSIPSLQAAERRRQASINNGKKGKSFGNRGGRPRKGETKEEAYDRRNVETPTKPLETPNYNTIDILQKPLETPKKPLEKEKEEEYEKDKEKDIYKEYSFEEFSNILKQLCIKFINKHDEYNYLLDIDCFKNHYYDNVCRFQRYVNEQLNTELSLEDCCYMITEYAKEYQE